MTKHGFYVMVVIAGLVLSVDAAVANSSAVQCSDRADGTCVSASPDYTWYYKIGNGNITVRLEVMYSGAQAPWVGW